MNTVKITERIFLPNRFIDFNIRNIVEKKVIEKFTNHSSINYGFISKVKGVSLICNRCIHFGGIEFIVQIEIERFLPVVGTIYTGQVVSIDPSFISVKITENIFIIITDKKMGKFKYDATFQNFSRMKTNGKFVKIEMDSTVNVELQEFRIRNGGIKAIGILV